MTKLLHIDEAFDTSLVASQAGVYKLHLSFNGQLFVLEKEFNVGDPIVFDISSLNEDYIYTCIELIKPDDTRQAIEIQIRIRITLS
ncbi:MAG: hypothetical protein NZ519_05085 [Bacteroidia bacterium]|nr:hypothetical protein [Bacteroidia bacterium]